MTTEPGRPGRFGERVFGWGAERRTPEGRASRRAIRSARRLGAWPVVAASAGTFFASMAFLAGQVRDGLDPALGPAEPVAAAKPRVVVVRRIIKRTVITHPAKAPSGGGNSAPAALPSTSSANPPSGGGSPAPAPAPAAPAPAPAPLTTQSS